MEVDAWARPEACAAAQSVFLLANENPGLRPSSGLVAERCAAVLAPGTRSIPRPIAETVIAAMPDEDVARLVELAGRLAAGRWRRLVEEVGADCATEPLLVGVASAAVAELVPAPAWLVAMREATAHAAPGPVDVLASLLPPEAVWSAREIHAARSASSSLSVLDMTAAVMDFARERRRTWRRQRARTIAIPLMRVLPVQDAPITSRHLAEALELVAAPSEADELCALLLLGAVMRLEGFVRVAPSLN